MSRRPSIAIPVWLSALFAVGCAGAPAPISSSFVSGTEPSSAHPRAWETLRLKDGATLKGYATAFDAKTQLLIFHTQEGRDVYLSLDDLDQKSAYRVMQATLPKGDADAQIRLGNSARDSGLYANAARHYGNAEKADPSKRAEIEGERAILRHKAAEFALQNARTAIRHDDLREAKKWLTRIVEKLPDEPQASEAAKLLDGLFMRDRLELDLPVAYDAPSSLAAALAPAKANYDEMLRKTREGLTVHDAGTESTAIWQLGLVDGEKGLRQIEQLEERYTDARSQALLTGYRQLFMAEIVELHLHLASVWTTRSSYHKALDEVNQALALDPHNVDALSARAHVQQAATNDSGWWY
jgi:tetratricopeptide (TPR) repeat protein